MENLNKWNLLGITPEHIKGYKCSDLIATYEELFEVPTEARVTTYFGDMGMYVVKYGVTDEAVVEVYIKGLEALGLSNAQYQSNIDFSYRGNIVIAMCEKNHMEIPDYVSQVQKPISTKKEQEKQTVNPAVKALTLVQLKTRKKKPVFIVSFHHEIERGWRILVDAEAGLFAQFNHSELLRKSSYNKTWVAYDEEPNSGEKETPERSCFGQLLGTLYCHLEESLKDNNIMEVLSVNIDEAGMTGVAMIKEGGRIEEYVFDNDLDFWIRKSDYK